MDLIKVGTLFLCVVVSAGPIGCSRSSKTVTTESASSDPYGERTIEHTTTTTEVADDDNSCGGVLSCTVNVLGEIIALPFRAVGALVSAIF